MGASDSWLLRTWHTGGRDAGHGSVLSRASASWTISGTSTPLSLTVPHSLSLSRSVLAWLLPFDLLLCVGAPSLLPQGNCGRVLCCAGSCEGAKAKAAVGACAWVRGREAREHRVGVRAVRCGAVQPTSRQAGGGALGWLGGRKEPREGEGSGQTAQEGAGVSEARRGRAGTAGQSASHTGRKRRAEQSRASAASANAGHRGGVQTVWAQRATATRAQEGRQSKAEWQRREGRGRAAGGAKRSI